jgi:hypothetical protein
MLAAFYRVTVQQHHAGIGTYAVPRRSATGQYGTRGTVDANKVARIEPFHQGLQSFSCLMRVSQYQSFNRLSGLTRFTDPASLSIESRRAKGNQRIVRSLEFLTDSMRWRDLS